MIFPSPCMHAKSLQLCLTLCDSMDYSPGDQAPLSMGFSRQENWNELLCPPPGDLSDPGIEPESLRSPTLAGRFFITSDTWEAPFPSPLHSKKQAPTSSSHIKNCSSINPNTLKQKT